MEFLKKKNFLFLFLWFFLLVQFSYSTKQEDCFNQLYLENNIFNSSNITYTDINTSISGFYLLNEPFMNLKFDTPIVKIRFYNFNETTTLKVLTWPTYRKYNYFELYVEDMLSFGSDFAGCGLINITPLGSYTLNTIFSSDYSYGDFNNYSIDKNFNSGGFKIVRTRQDMYDKFSNPFVKLTIDRVYLIDPTLYFKMYDVFDDFEFYLNKYKMGDLSAFDKYVNFLIGKGDDYTKYLFNYELYFGLNTSSSINSIPVNSFNDSIPLSSFLTLNLSKIDSVEMNNLINNINSEITNLSLISTFPNTLINLTLNTSLISSSKFIEINDKLKGMLNTIDRGGLFKPLNLTPLIKRVDFDTLVYNYNMYISNKFCVNEDFICTSWDKCNLGKTHRLINKKRICFEKVTPTPVADCQWRLDRNSGTFTSSRMCSSDTYRKDIYRDVLNFNINDYCGVYSMNSWLGHEKTVNILISSFDTCGGDGGN
jgi:hypothetical protein